MLFDSNLTLQELYDLIDTLTVSSESTTQLVSILKAVYNLNGNSSVVENEVTSRVQAVDSSTAPEELALLVAGLKIFDRDRTVLVNTASELPDATVTQNGTTYYVDDIKVLVYAINGRWVTIDGRTLADDRELSLVFTWGGETFGGVLGNGYTQRPVPTSVLTIVADWQKISSPHHHTLAIREDGSLWGWGRNNNQQLGVPTPLSFNNEFPIPISQTQSWQHAAAGYTHSLAVSSTGVAWAWGENTISGALGDGTTTNRASPVTVVGGITNWAKVAAGERCSLGLTSDGIAYAWGNNNYGKLGDGTSEFRSSPVTVVGGITNWSQLSMHGYHSLGVTADGIAYAWGAASLGRLGDGTTVSKSSPVTVVGGITNWAQVSAGRRHSVGLTSSGIVYTWGNGALGRLGDGTTVNKSSPVTILGGITNWTQISAGYAHTLGLTADGVIYAWGNGSLGRLGDGLTENRSSPVTVIGGVTTWQAVSAGSSHSTAIKLGN